MYGGLGLRRGVGGVEADISAQYKSKPSRAISSLLVDVGRV